MLNGKLTAIQNKEFSTALIVLVVAFVVRIGGIMVTSVTNLNPDSQYDENRFAAMAESIAAGEMPVSEALSNLQHTDTLMGLVNAPFWLLPGPSLLYARLGHAFLGAIAVYNIYILARHLHSHHAGLLAAAPILIFPSHVAVHSTILREAIILCALTTAIRLAVVPSRWPTTVRYGFALLFVAVSAFFRLDNLVVYGAMIGAGVFAYLVQWRREMLLSVFIAAPVAYYSYVNYFYSVVADRIYRREDNLVDFVYWFRNSRIHEGGRSVYLTDTLPESVSEILAFAPIAAIYFVYVPFPWMIETVHDAVVGVEGIIILFYTIFAAFGVRYVIRRNLPVAVSLLAGFVLFITFYGLISANVGTAMRQRQVLYWVLPFFGGIGIAQQYEAELNKLSNRIELAVETHIRPLYEDRVTLNDPDSTSSEAEEQSESTIEASPDN